MISRTGTLKPKRTFFTNLSQLEGLASLSYLVREEDLAVAGAAKAKYFGVARPASATLIVPALIKSGWLIEIEAVAAKSD